MRPGSCVGSHLLFFYFLILSLESSSKAVGLELCVFQHNVINVKVLVTLLNAASK